MCSILCNSTALDSLDLHLNYIQHPTVYCAEGSSLKIVMQWIKCFLQLRISLFPCISCNLTSLIVVQWIGQSSADHLLSTRLQCKNSARNGKHVFVHSITNCIFPSWILYLSKIQNVFGKCKLWMANQMHAASPHRCSAVQKQCKECKKGEGAGEREGGGGGEGVWCQLLY